jgi:hypothetical protein
VILVGSLIHLALVGLKVCYSFICSLCLLRWFVWLQSQAHVSHDFSEHDHMRSQINQSMESVHRYTQTKKKATHKQGKHHPEDLEEQAGTVFKASKQKTWKLTHQPNNQTRQPTNRANNKLPFHSPSLT